MIKLIKNNSGFSLMELMISVALGGAMSVAIAKLSVDQMKVKNTAIQISDTNKAYYEIDKITNDLSSCNRTFGGIEIDKGESGVSIENGIWARFNRTPATVPQVPEDANQKFQIGQQYGKLRISNITLDRGDQENFRDMTLNVEFEKLSPKHSLGARTITKTFPFKASFEQDGVTILSCNPFDDVLQVDEVMESFCESQAANQMQKFSKSAANLSQTDVLEFVDCCGNTHLFTQHIEDLVGGVSSVNNYPAQMPINNEFTDLMIPPQTNEFNPFEMGPISKRSMQNITIVLSGGGGGGGAGFYHDDATGINMFGTASKEFAGKAGAHGQVVVATLSTRAGEKLKCNGQIGHGGTAGFTKAPESNPDISWSINGQDGQDSWITCTQENQSANTNEAIETQPTRHHTLIAKGGKGGQGAAYDHEDEFSFDGEDTKTIHSGNSLSGKLNVGPGRNANDMGGFANRLVRGGIAYTALSGQQAHEKHGIGFSAGGAGGAKFGGIPVDEVNPQNTYDDYSGGNGQAGILRAIITTHQIIKPMFPNPNHTYLGEDGGCMDPSELDAGSPFGPGGP